MNNFLNLSPRRVTGSLGGLLLLILPVLLSSTVFTQPADPSSGGRHHLAQALEYVDEEGLVDYRELQQDRRHLDRFRRALGELSRDAYLSWEEPAQIAFWINAYNGLTLLLIIDHYPIEASFFGSLLYPENSIRQISGAWDEITYPVMGMERTLDEIEHRILRKEFDEPRIHLALVCAARGCPPLRTEPYRGDRLDRQLDDQARRFLNNPQQFKVDWENKTIFLSRIFEWYGEDFTGSYGNRGPAGRGRTERAVLDFIGRYVGEKERSVFEDDDFRIEYLEYDWSLNETPNP